MKPLLLTVILVLSAFSNAWAKNCTWDSDCKTGYMCNDGECRMGKWPDGGCTWDSDCLDGYECKNGECESKPDFIGKILVKAGKIQKAATGCVE